MKQQMHISTSRQVELKEITREIDRVIAAAGLKQGMCLVFCPHTTAGLIINEHADPDVRLDLERAFEKLVPGIPFAHVEGNSPAHFLSSVVGASLLVPVRDGRLQLGTWQGVFFCEFDGPRARQIWVQLIE
jgi:secondary thiamine-phosphate synthase enzyme